MGARYRVFLYSTVGFLRRKSGGNDLWEWLATFPTGFSIDFIYGKLTKKVTSGNHETMGYCNYWYFKCKLVAKHMDYDHMTRWGLRWLELWEQVISTTCSVSSWFWTVAEWVVVNQRLHVLPLKHQKPLYTVACICEGLSSTPFSAIMNSSQTQVGWMNKCIKHT